MRFQCRLWIEKKAAEKTITETKDMPREQHEKFKGFAEGARAAVVGTARDSQSQGERGHLSALRVRALTLTCCPATADGDPSEQQQL